MRMCHSACAHGEPFKVRWVPFVCLFFTVLFERTVFGDRYFIYPTLLNVDLGFFFVIGSFIFN